MKAQGHRMKALVLRMIPELELRKFPPVERHSFPAVRHSRPLERRMMAPDAKQRRRWGLPRVHRQVQVVP